MNTLTFKVTMPSNAGSNISINIIGTNLHIDYGDGRTTTQEPNTERIEERRFFSNFTSSTVTITGNITGLGYQFLYQGGRYVTEITLPEGLETIESYALSHINAEEVIIPSTVTNISDNFLYESSVKKVVFLTKNLTTIGSYFLYNNSQIEAIKLPEGLLSIGGARSFNACTGLKTLEVPSTFEAFPSSVNSFINVQLETLKMNGGPISNPPINENTKIIVPLSKLQEFLNHSSYPNERERYDVFGKNLSEKVYVLGTHLAENLQDKNIVASANEGLTTLANKIYDIDAPNYKKLTYNLAWNDNYNEYGFRPSQFPILLLANNEVVGGCLLPRDDMTNIDQKISSQEIYNLTNIQASANNCGTFAELQAIIDEANDGDTITLEKDYKNAGAEEPLEIYRKSLHIIGDGHILDGNNVTIIMDSSGSDETVLEDIYFINGNGAEYCGGALCGWEETLINCAFINNNGYTGGACRMGDGAIISNCLFINNTSFAGALAIHDVPVKISECIFINNIAEYGGGIWFDYSDNYGPESINVYDCLFDDVSTLYHVNNIQSKYSYIAQVPESDLNGEEITYTWEPLKLAREYGVPQVNTSEDISSTTMTPVQMMITVQGDIFNSLNNRQFISIRGKLNVIIDWGDNTVELYDSNAGFLHHAFSDGRDKHTITIGGNISYLGSSCFANNTSITNITFLDDNITLSGIGQDFLNCSSLTSIVLPDKLTSLPWDCFAQCSALESIVLPDSITSVGGGCFDGCSSLTNIVLSNNLTSLSNAFLQGCSSLTSITLPNGLTSIGANCFKNCSSLTSITLPNTLTNIGGNCFDGCSNLSSINLPNTITSIPSSCFNKCSSLTNIILPDNITSIGGSSFYSAGLTNITIPSAVTNIGSYCFASCRNLTDITFQNPTPPSFASYVFNNITITIHVPQGAKSAYETALEGTLGTHNWTIVEES